MIDSVAKAREEVLNKNMTAVVEHANETRKQIRILEAEVKTFKTLVLQQKQEIEGLRVQLNNLLVEIYKHKATE